MGPKTASALALLAVAAAIECPDETWLKLNDKCYSKQASGTHAECATICGANASLVHITSHVPQRSRGVSTPVTRAALLVVRLEPAIARSEGPWSRILGVL